MSKPAAISELRALASSGSRSGTEATLRFPDRRRTPRPPLAEIKRGGKLNLFPPNVVTGAVRAVEFLIVALLGFAIFHAYVDHDGDAHMVYLVAVLIAAIANMVMFQAGVVRAKF